MNDRIIYRPYRSLILLLPFSILIAVVNFLMTGLSVPNGDFSSLIFILIGFLALYATKIAYDAAHMVILFDGDGLQIIGRRYKNDSFHLWKDLPYAYGVRNYRGFCFVLLSPRTLSPKEARHNVRRNVNPFKTSVDDYVVISIDDQQNMSHLRELIAGHTMYIDVN